MALAVRWMLTALVTCLVIEAVNSQIMCPASTQLDLVFVVGQSSTIEANNPSNGAFDNWQQILQFIVNVVQSFSIGPQQIQVGIVTYSNYGSLAIKLGQYPDTQILQTQIMALKSGSGQNDIYQGLYTMRTSAFNPANGARSNVMKVAIFITDGPANPETSLVQPEASADFNAGIRIFSIGLTPNAVEDQIRAISIPPQTPNINYYMVPDYFSIGQYVDQLAATVCTPPKPSLPGCQMVDLAFAYGQPSSQQAFNYVQTFIQDYIAAYTTIGQQATQVSIVQFGYNTASVQIPFSSSTSEQNLLNKLSSTGYQSGSSNDVFNALMLMNTTVFKASNGARVGNNNVTRIAVLIVDNPSYQLSQESLWAQTLRNSGINVYVIDVSEGNVNIDEDRTIATSPSGVIVTNYGFLTTIIGQLSSMLCNPYNVLNVACPAVADIVLILDQSTSIVVPGYSDWTDDVLGFAVNLVSSFPIGPNLTQFGCLKFSDVIEDNFYLNTFNDKAAMVAYIQQIQLDGGETDIAGAIRDARTNQFIATKGARPGVKKLLFLVTDGEANREASATIPEASLTKAAGIEIFTIGMTKQINVQQLQAIASAPWETHYFYVSDYGLLNTVIQSVLENSCKVLPTVTPATLRPVVTRTTTSRTTSTSITTTASKRTTTSPKTTISPTTSTSRRTTTSGVTTTSRKTTTSHRTTTSVRTTTSQKSTVSPTTTTSRTTTTSPKTKTTTSQTTSTSRKTATSPVTTTSRKTTVSPTTRTSKGTTTSAKTKTTTSQSTSTSKVTTTSAKTKTTTSGVTTTSRVTTTSLKTKTSQVTTTSPTTSSSHKTTTSMRTTTSAKTTTTKRSINSLDEVSATCRRRSDVIFVVDTTRNMNYNYFVTYLEGFLQTVVGNLQVDGGWTQVGVIGFAETAWIEFSLNTYTRTVDVRNAMLKIKYGGNVANLADGLNLMRTVGFSAASGARLDDITVVQIGVIITDNVNPNASEILHQAMLARKANISLITFGVGTYLDPYTLSAVCTAPYSLNMFTVGTAKNMSQFADPVKRLICRDDSICGSVKCQNNAKCVEGFDQPMCVCPPGFGGADCSSTCNHGANVVFCLDSSGSIGLMDFQRMTTFVGSIIQSLDIDSSPDGPTISRVGLLTFADYPVVQFYLDTYTTLTDLLQYVNVPYSMGATNTAQAIQMVREVIFNPQNGARPNYQNYLIIMTDGMSGNTTATWQQAMQTRAAGINIMAVGVGVQANFAELDSIATTPVTKNVYYAADFESLTDSLRLQIVSNLCQSSDTCSGNQCMNGATCKPGMDSYSCGPCPSLYTGINCERTCTGIIDLVFVIDAAGTVHQERFMNLTNYAISVVQQLDVGPTRTQVGLVYWSGNAYMGFTLNRYNNQQDVIQAIRTIPYVGGRTMTSAALQMLQQLAFTTASGDRAGARNVAIVVGNGPSTISPSQTISQAVACREAGILMISVPVEPVMQNSMDMVSIASFPRSRNTIYVPSFSALPIFVNQTVWTLCNSVNNCMSNPCQNGGTCINDFGRYLCSCMMGYAGYNCERQCQSAVDVVFVIDVADPYVMYKPLLDLARTISYGLDVDHQTAQVAAVAYSSVIEGQFSLLQYTNRESVANAMDFYSSNMVTNTQLALQTVSNNIFTSVGGLRSNAKHIIIVMSDGYTTADPVPIATTLKNSESAQIFYIAAGDPPEMVSVTETASSPDASYIYLFDLTTNASTIIAGSILDMICTL